MAINIKIDVTLIDAVAKVAKAAREKRLVLFIGAGVSRNAGYPDWQTLLTPAVEAMGGDWEDYKNKSLPKVAEIYQYHCGGDREPLRELLDNSLGENKELSQVHLALPGLLPCLVATTNYDRLLQSTFPAARLAASPGAAARMKPDELAILHLHGHLDHQGETHDGLILTDDDYAQVGTLKAQFFERLRCHWQDSLILFLGYRAGDDDVADASRTVRAIYGATYATRHLAIDLSGEKNAALQAYWTPFCADVVQSAALEGDHPGDKLLNFLHACITTLGGTIQQQAAGNKPHQIQTAAVATASCQALAKLLSNPLTWDALKNAGRIGKLETEVREIRQEPSFHLPTAQALYNLIANPGTDPKRLLRRMAAVVISSQNRIEADLKKMDTLVRNAIIAMCIVLAERYIHAEAAAAPTGQSLSCEASAPINSVPINTEAIAMLIAAVWIHDDTGVQLKIGVVARDGAPIALGALNVTNTPLEPGYPPAESPLDLVKAQIWQRVHAQAACKPNRPWKEQALDDFTDQHIPALKSLINQEMGDGLTYDLVLTLDANRLDDHILGHPLTRAEIQDKLGIWTVIYGATSASLDATRELAEIIETAFNGIFAHL
jgi:hypothetical protein